MRSRASQNCVPKQKLGHEEIGSQNPDHAGQTALDSPKGRYAQIELMNKPAVPRAPSARRSEEEGTNHTPTKYGQRDNGWQRSTQMPIFKGVLNAYPLSNRLDNGTTDDRPGIRPHPTLPQAWGRVGWGLRVSGAQCNILSVSRLTLRVPIRFGGILTPHPIPPPPVGEARRGGQRQGVD
jgi:hypothetical protein